MGWYNHRDGYMTLSEAATFFGTSVTTVTTWIKSGELKAEVFDGEKPKYWINKEVADEFDRTNLIGFRQNTLSKSGFTSIKDIAKMYGVRAASVRDWIECGYLAATMSRKGKKTTYMVSDDDLNEFDKIYSSVPKNSKGHAIKQAMKRAFKKEGKVVADISTPVTNSPEKFVEKVDSVEDKIVADISNQETSSLEKFVNEVNARFDNYKSLNESYNAVSNQMHKDIIKTMEIYGYTDIDENVMSHVLAITFRAPSLAKLRMDMDDEREAIKKLFVEAGITERLFWGDWSDE